MLEYKEARVVSAVYAGETTGRKDNIQVIIQAKSAKQMYTNTEK